MDEEDEGESPPIVALMTVDFAMQNVMLQLGLKLVSIDETRVLKRTTHFNLRCHACFKTTEDMSRKFCGGCGNVNTLKRVSVTVNEDGVKEIYINPKRTINTRGMKYSLPHPQGGKHSNNLFLVADQPIPQHKRNSAAFKEKKLMGETIMEDPSYILRNNPFAKHDVYSRAARVRNIPERVDHLIPTGNPNVMKKCNSRKNKTRN